MVIISSFCADLGIISCDSTLLLLWCQVIFLQKSFKSFVNFFISYFILSLTGSNTNAQKDPQKISWHSNCYLLNDWSNNFRSSLYTYFNALKSQWNNRAIHVKKIWIFFRNKISGSQDLRSQNHL